VKIVKYVFRFLLIVVVGALALGGSLALIAPAARRTIFGTTAYGSVLPAVAKAAERSNVYDRYGNQIDTLYSEDRSSIALKLVPKNLVNAVLSIEDHNFYKHHGVDWKATARAFVDNLGAGHVQQGGSTITQQLVKNTLIKHPKRDLQRKIQEAFLAQQLEKELTKDQILERYLNVIYFGDGAYGVRAAAERYFGKEPQQLDLADSAMIGGLIQSPEQLNPIVHPAAARARRARVLDAMVRYHKITSRQSTDAKREPLPTKTHMILPHRNAADANYLTWVINNVLLRDDPNVNGDVGEILANEYGSAYDAIFRGGLKIYTAFDPILQAQAQAAIDAHLPAQQFTAAMAVIDNATGGVVAEVQGSNYHGTSILPLQGHRQVGSTFKGVTLATALEAGYSPNDTVSGLPFHISIPGQQPYNLSSDCGNKIHTLSDAIWHSDNCAFVRTEMSLGPGHYGTDGARRVLDMAKRLGIDTTQDNPVLTTTLGVGANTVLDMTTAYSVFANSGVLRRPVFVTKIVAPGGKVIFQDPGLGTSVLTPQIANTETEMLKGVIQSGTGTGANIGRPAAGKTGTTTKHADAWFVGYTPQFTAGVWMGDPNGENSMVPVLGNVFGGKYPASMWHDFMLAATARLAPTDFPPADQNAWPSPQFIDETGRTLHFVPPTPITTAPPPTTPPANTTPTTAKKKTTTTTAKKTTSTTKKPGNGNGHRP